MPWNESSQAGQGQGCDLWDGDKERVKYGLSASSGGRKGSVSEPLSCGLSEESLGCSDGRAALVYSCRLSSIKVTTSS